MWEWGEYRKVGEDGQIAAQVMQLQGHLSVDLLLRLQLLLCFSEVDFEIIAFLHVMQALGLHLCMITVQLLDLHSNTFNLLFYIE